MFRFLDEIFDVLIDIFVLAVGIALCVAAFHFYPLITSIIGVMILAMGLLFILGKITQICEQHLAKNQMQRLSTLIIYTLTAGLICSGVAIAFYTFPKISAVLLGLALLGWIAEKGEKTKDQKAA